MVNVSNISDGPKVFTSSVEAISAAMFGLDDVVINGTNSPNSLNDNSTLEAVDRSWIYYGIGPFICMFGTVCNIVNLCVLLHKSLHEAPYTYLTALATVDLAFLIISFVHLVMYKSEPTYSKAFFDIYVFFCFGNACFNISVWITVVMTLERVLFVKNPLKFRPSRTKARIEILIIFIFCCFINIPRMFCYKIIHYKGGYYPRALRFKGSREYFDISLFHAVIVNFIPLLSLTAANCFLLVALHKAGIKRVFLRTNQEEISRRDQTRLTRTLVAIVVVFFICTTPSAFVEEPIAYTLFGGNKTWSEYLKSPANQTFISISNLLLFVNSGLNFLLYCAFNKRFRQVMKVFCIQFSPCRSQAQVTNTTFKSGPNNSTVTTRFRITLHDEGKNNIQVERYKHVTCRL